MRKVIKQYQNNFKALEVRLEEESNNQYYVVLAGTMNGGCVSGRCDAGSALDSQTYMMDQFPDYNIANQAFETVKDRYIDYHR